MLPEELLQPKNIDDFMENFLQVSQEWAEIAEAEQVEFLSPLNEPNAILGDDKAQTWAEFVLPKVRERFTGDVILKFADLGPESDFTGYDYIAFDVYWCDTKFDELQTHLANAVERARRYVADYGIKGVIFGEMGAQVEEESGWGEQHYLVSEEDQAKIMDMMFNDTWGELKGYFVAWGSGGPFSVRGRPAEEIVKKWYSKP